jgi:predicted transcriptional regulator of viral defense system
LGIEYIRRCTGVLACEHQKATDVHEAAVQLNDTGYRSRSCVAYRVEEDAFTRADLAVDLVSIKITQLAKTFHKMKPILVGV